MTQVGLARLTRAPVASIFGVWLATSFALSGQSVTSFTIWDVTNRKDPVALSGYNPIPEGATLDLSTLPVSLGITATTDPGRVGSVVFDYNGEVFHIENNDPQPSFNGNGQVGSTYYPKPYSFAPIYTTLTATPWTHSEATGNAGSALDLHINIRQGSPSITFAQASDAAFTTLITEFYNSNDSRTDGSYWNYVWPHDVSSSSRTDWIADTGTYLLAFLYSLNSNGNNSQTISSAMMNLNEGGPDYSPCTTVAGTCVHKSDVTQWDAVAAMRELSVIGNVPTVAGSLVTTLSRAIDDFNYLDGAPYNVTDVGFAYGACPSINYQQSGGDGNQVKTLETDSNYIKTAILLSQYYASLGNVSNYPSLAQNYLNKAVSKYQAVKNYFADTTVGGIPSLYTVYLIDNGKSCAQIPQRFYASVNGIMIWNGWELASMVTDVTGANYSSDAIATAKAVVANLSDSMGIYENLEAGCDVAEPLVESMYLLATDPVNPQAFAKAWILSNAGIVAANVRSDGTYSRLLGGPATSRTNSASDLLSAAGGFALVMAAGAMSPNEGAFISPWSTATYIDVTSQPSGAALNDSSPPASWPVTLSFTGHGIALIGTRGEISGDNLLDDVQGHARVFIDGVETADKTGIWQSRGVSNSVSPSPFNNDVLFAWQWPSGSPAMLHTIAIQPGVYNVKEGGAFIHVVGYYVIP
jgi:hypothetical protein